MKKLVLWGAVAVLAVAAVVWLLVPENGGGTGPSRVGDGGTPIAQDEAAKVSAAREEAASPKSSVEPAEPESSEEAEEPMSAEEKAAAEEEAKVEAFDNLTDKWLEPVKAGVNMKDIDEFAAMFRRVPKDRQDECIHRALNLVPDENVMLLAGILMDKKMDKEIVEAVFNDVLNRDEDVKKPILLQIFKDKKHPCWEDAAWILDVTDEVPKAETK